MAVTGQVTFNSTQVQSTLLSLQDQGIDGEALERP